MIKIENVIIPSWEQMQTIIKGMRNPLNSWEKSDSIVEKVGDQVIFTIGHNDQKLMYTLAKGGPTHGKFKRMMTVYSDITAPLYWWKEFDTYKVGTVANSCSTMHKIADKEFTLDDFSHEHLFNKDDMIDHAMTDEKYDMSKDDTLSAVNVDGNLCYFTPKHYIQMTCDILNHYRQKYLDTKDKKYWWQMIQLLPSSYNQKRTVMLNYEVLTNIYSTRLDHKLDEWRDFCKETEKLPLFDTLIRTNVPETVKK